MVSVLAAVIVLVCVGAAYAAHDEVPRIPVAETKKLMDDKAGIVISIPKSKSMYDKGHIKGAINFPWKMEISPEDARSLPKIS